MRQNERRWKVLAGAGALLIAAIGLSSAARNAEAATTWLGVYTQDLTDQLREGIRYDGAGVLVNRVVDDSPASRAGIQKGDVIVRFNSRQIDDADELTELVREARAGQSVAVQVVRDGSRRTLNVRLDEREGGESPQAERWSWRSDDEDRGDRKERVRVRRAPRVHIERHGDGDDDADAPHVYRFEVDGDGDHPELHRLMPHLDELRGVAPLIGTPFGRGRLGVSIQDLNDGLSEYFETEKGALVTDVADDSPAAKAGFKAGDVITRFDGKDITDTGDLMRAVRAAGEGAVDVTVMRKGRSVALRPELERARSSSWSWNEGDGERIRAQVERAREQAERARERAERGRERIERRQEGRAGEAELRREMERLSRELRALERRLERMNSDED